jgi:hypothetical protein
MASAQGDYQSPLRFLKQEPCRWAFTLVHSVFAPYQVKALSLDQLNVRSDQPVSELRRFENSIHEPMSIYSKHAVQLSQIVFSFFDAVKTSHIERQIEWAVNPVELGRIADAQIRLNVCILNFAFCNLNGARRKINPDRLPPVLNQRDDIRASATAQIDGAARWMFGYEIKEFWRRDAAIPRRTPQIPEIEVDAAKKVH